VATALLEVFDTVLVDNVTVHQSHKITHGNEDRSTIIPAA